MAKKISDVWLNFSEEKKRKVKCLTCGQQLSVANKSTCSLIRHLKRRHPFQAITRQETYVIDESFNSNPSNLSLPPIRKMMAKKYSDVWLNFSEEKMRKVKCLICGQWLSVANGSTCSLIRHMKRRHPFQSFDKQPKKKKNEQIDRPIPKLIGLMEVGVTNSPDSTDVPYDVLMGGEETKQHNNTFEEILLTPVGTLQRDIESEDDKRNIPADPCITDENSVCLEEEVLENNVSFTDNHDQHIISNEIRIDILPPNADTESNFITHSVDAPFAEANMQPNASVSSRNLNRKIDDLSEKYNELVNRNKEFEERVLRYLEMREAREKREEERKRKKLELFEKLVEKFTV